jgi:hypothetical protein
VVLTTSSFATFVVMQLAMLVGLVTNAYVGLIVYLLFPTLFVIGLLLIPIAWRRQVRASDLSTKKLLEAQRCLADAVGDWISDDCTLCHSILANDETEPFAYLSEPTRTHPTGPCTSTCATSSFGRSDRECHQGVRHDTSRRFGPRHDRSNGRDGGHLRLHRASQPDLRRLPPDVEPSRRGYPHSGLDRHPARLFDNEQNYLLSRNSYGLSFEGRSMISSSSSLFYRLEYAEQRDAGENSGHVDSDYHRADVGVNLEHMNLKIGFEVLGGSPEDGRFLTPLATLHKFNGWADLFLGTPENGLLEQHSESDVHAELEHASGHRIADPVLVRLVTQILAEQEDRTVEIEAEQPPG